MKRYAIRYRKQLGVIGAGIALGVAVLYLVVTPTQAMESSGMTRMILLYAHSLCWLLLAAACVLWAMKRATKWVPVVAYSALAVYAVFIVTYFINQ